MGGNIQEEIDACLAAVLQSEEQSRNSAMHSSPKAAATRAPLAQDISTEVLPDLHALFLQYNEQYFWGSLAGIEVKWSHRMTLCAGLCLYQRLERFCSIRLSEPLLKFRPVSDMIDTLLHEMIHAYLFVTENNRDRDGHGPEFHRHMHRINQMSGSNITVYHNFRDEVDFYRTHVWRCSGPCQHRQPFFGYVKRSMNRPPQRADYWFDTHQRTCGGTFVKISEPAKPIKAAKGAVKGRRLRGNQDSAVGRSASKTPNKLLQASPNASSDQTTLDTLWTKGATAAQKPQQPPQPLDKEVISLLDNVASSTTTSASIATTSIDLTGPTAITSTLPMQSARPSQPVALVVLNSTAVVQCPVCNLANIPTHTINAHLDQCLL
ncbi:hypothetical protein H4R35_001102 [Dimargaris xerosporica]|nr:hypothetical protein H4R35_001102 [Dimargaris xerosporica]